jgi:hypothetical protein
LAIEVVGGVVDVDCATVARPARLDLLTNSRRAIGICALGGQIL